MSFIGQLSGVTLPQGAQQSAEQAALQGLGTILTVSGILALLFPSARRRLPARSRASDGKRPCWAPVESAAPSDASTS